MLVNEFWLEVLNNGPEARVAILEAYMNQMMEGIDFQIEGDMFRHGQSAGNGVSDNRQASINGISEAVNDGVTPSWDGNVFPTYGGRPAMEPSPHRSTRPRYGWAIRTATPPRRTTRSC